ncbi:chaperonin 10-like protein [Schizophyllum commune]
MSSSAHPAQVAAVLYGGKDLRIEEREALPPKEGQVQVAVKATGLCGSDLHYYTHGRNGDFKLQAPMVLGHEAAGIITAVGPGVTGLSPGQRVAIECGIMCKTCRYCKAGRYNLCKGMRFCSSAKTFPHLDGTLQTYLNHDADLMFPLPDDCSYEMAALAEPLSVLIHASRRAQFVSGQTVLVFGVGAIGLLAAALASAQGASKVVAIDINETRLAFAKENGFVSDTFCLPKGDRNLSPEEQLKAAKDTILPAVARFGEPDGFDVVYECTGAAPCIQMSIHAAITGGRVMLVGMGTGALMLPVAAAATREVDVLGSFRYANTYPEALALLGSGKLDKIEKLVTHRIPLKDAVSAFELLAKGQDEQGNMALKVVITGP